MATNKEIDAESKGTGTWNDEEYIILERQDNGTNGTQSSGPVEKKRFHLRGKDDLNDSDYNEIKGAIQNLNAADSIEILGKALDAIKAGEPKDIRLADILAELKKNKATEWRLALVIDTPTKGPRRRYFEIWKEF